VNLSTPTVAPFEFAAATRARSAFVFLLLTLGCSPAPQEQDAVTADDQAPAAAQIRPGSGPRPAQADAALSGASNKEAPAAERPAASTADEALVALRPDAGGVAGDGSPPGAPAVCAPSGGGPHWLEEGGRLRFPIACATGMRLPGDAFEVAGLPTGATYDPATASVEWTPRLNQAGVYVLTVRAPRLGEEGVVKVGVADKYDDPANAPLADPAKYTEEFGLPVFHLTTSPLLTNKMHTPAKLVYRGKTYEMEAKHRGASSLAYPKKNFTLKFAKEDKFTEPEHGGGLRKRRRLALITTFDDTTHLRWRMAFELWNRMDPMNIQIRHYSAVLYLNGKYHGLYAVSDKIDKNMMGAHGMSEDGNLYMAKNHTANFGLIRHREQAGGRLDQPKVSLAEGYEKKEGLPEAGQPGAFDDLIALVGLVARGDDAKFTAEIGKAVRLRDVFNWMIHCTAIVANDTYAKNAVLYHDTKTPGPWRFVLWDFNASFGQAWDTVRTPHAQAPREIIDRAVRNDLWRRLWTHPKFGPEVRALFASVLKNELKIEDLTAFLDGMAKIIEPSARRDERKWFALHRTFFKSRSSHTDFEQELAYLRKWLRDRWAYLQTVVP
jgi:hypothetical protein